jgi:hypothetical protein
MRASEQQPKVRRRHIGPFLVAGALIGLLLIAFILSLAEHKLPELALTLTIYLFTTTLAVFVIERMLASFARRGEDFELTHLLGLVEQLIPN